MSDRTRSVAFCADLSFGTKIRSCLRVQTEETGLVREISLQMGESSPAGHINVLYQNILHAELVRVCKLAIIYPRFPADG